MSGKRYVKVCPNKSCVNRINEDDSLDCSECGRDLTKIKKYEFTSELEETVNAGEDWPPKAVATPLPKEDDVDGNTEQKKLNMIRICDSCGYHNSTSQSYCESCGEYILDIVAIPSTSDATGVETVQQPASSIQYSLVSLDEGFIYCIIDSRIIIGREKECASYLMDKDYVSREHAVLTVEDGQLFIADRKATNRNYIGGVNNNTFVNGISLKGIEKRKLQCGDIIGLGDPNENEPRAAFLQVREA